MIILPGHLSRKRKIRWVTDNVEVEPASSAGQPNHDDPEEPCVTFPETAAFDGYYEPNPPGRPNDPINSRTNAEPFPTMGATANGIQEFDEHGAELGPEARVWKTYVKEADRFDLEKVEEWNKSLDVILIFAALFSAISTTFVMESSKKLYEDPVDTSAQTLAIISQTLLVIANNSQGLVPNNIPPSDKKFIPTRSDVCVNILWFLSLSISVAVSLIAMLAKEWCYIFMSNRTGDPRSQSKRRQQRWDALEHWKMPEVLMFLPSLIHLALLLFAVGLCIYLWDMHFGVALPVLAVTTLAIGVYAASTILPLMHQLCPYSTAASRFITSLRGTLAKESEPNGPSFSDQDVVSSKALCWLIEKCEDPRSVDIALQAIAGADDSISLEPLKKCNAEKMVCQRMTSGSNYGSNHETVFKLYARAFAALRPSITSSSHDKGYNDINELRRKIWHLQIDTESAAATLLATKLLIPTQIDLFALRVGSTTALCSLKPQSYGLQGQALESLNAAVEILEKYWNKTTLLHPAALQLLVTGTAVLLSCSAIHVDASTIAPYIIRLVAACPDPSDRLLGLLLSAFSLARNNYPGWTHPGPLGVAARAERAIEVIAHYAHGLESLGQILPGTLKNFGLLELLTNLQEYQIIDTNLEYLHDAPTLAWIDDTHVIHTFPLSFDLRQHAQETISKKTSHLYISEPDDTYTNHALIEAHLAVLRITQELWAPTHTPLVYVFVIRSVCLAPTRRVLSTSNVLLAKNIPHSLSADLATLLGVQNVIPLLANTLDSTDLQLRIFAITHLQNIIELFLHTGQESRNNGADLLTELFRCEELCNPRKRLKSVKEALLDELANSSVGDSLNRKKFESVNKLRIKLREARIVTARAVSSWLVSEHYFQTEDGPLGLGIGGMAADLCLRSLGSTKQKQMLAVLNYAVSLLERYGDEPHILHPTAVRSLVIGTATLLACSTTYSDPSTIASYVVRILHADIGDAFLGVLLVSFALANNEYTSQSTSLSKAARAERALEAIMQYAPNIGSLNTIPYAALKNLGLLELLSNSSRYRLSKTDFTAIYTEFESVWDTEPEVPRVLSQPFDLGQYVLQLFTLKASESAVLDGVFSSKESVIAHLDALRCTYKPSVGRPTPQVLAFIWECFCRASTSQEEIIIEQIIDQFPSAPVLSDYLAVLISGRNIATLLAHALESGSMRIKVFATAHVCLLLRLLFESPKQLSNSSWASLLANMFRCEEKCAPVTRLKKMKRALTLWLDKMRVEFPQYPSARIFPPDMSSDQGSNIAIPPSSEFSDLSSITSSIPRSPRASMTSVALDFDLNSPVRRDTPPPPLN